MQVLAVQLNMTWQDKAENYDAARALVAEAQPEAGSLIVLPEMFATGFCMNLQATADEERASEAVLKEIASQYDCAVLGGVVGPIVNGVATNEAVAFAPDGSELVRYVKQQPFTLSAEDRKYRAGSEHKLFQWQGVKVAPFICYDLRFPERFRPAAAEGAELIVVMACWPEIRSEHWVRLLQARAIENLAAVVGVNRCGEEPNLTFDGRSTAFDHMGVQLFEASSREQAVKTLFDIKTLRTWRKKFPALDDMRL